MRFFSGKGDSGFTTQYNGSKLPKDNQKLTIIGDIDEAVAFIGFAISSIEEKNLRQDMHKVQENLSYIMSVLSGDDRENHEEIISTSILWLEAKISTYGEGLDKPKSFIFPGKTTIGAVLDICRTIIRRAERSTVGYFRNNKNHNENILTYLNRLSSFFYVLQLYVDQKILPSF